MFGIGSQKDDILEEQYRLKYLKYKEKYLKLKQSGGFGKTSTGVYCILTNEEKAGMIEVLAKQAESNRSLSNLTKDLHDLGYAIPDGTKEAKLIIDVTMSGKLASLGTKFSNWKNKNKEPPKTLNNVEKVKLNTVMNRCDIETVKKIRDEINEANTEKTIQVQLTHMVVLNLTLTNFNLIGEKRYIQ